MAPRKRSEKYAQFDLPDNVEITTKKLADGSTAVYARYVFPPVKGKTKRQRSPNIGKLPDDLANIKAAATALNLKFYSDNNIFGDLVEKHKQTFYKTSNPPVEQVIQEFDKQWISEQGYSSNYYKVICYRLSMFKSHFEGKEINAFTTYEISRFLATLKKEPARQAKTLLSRLFMFAKSQGYYTQPNPVTDVLPIKHSKRKRKRHTHDGVWAIYDYSPDWMQRAMGVAIFSLQRRGDLVKLHKEHNKVDTENRTIEILQGKVDVYMEITMGEELYSHVQKCIKSDVPCPYLLHRRYQRQKTEQRKARPHPFAIMPDYLTRAFREFRDKSGVYDHLPMDERPAFHDLRAYGIFAYFKAGYAIEYIQVLAGHASKKMTEHYIKGHEKRKPMKVNAELSIDAVDWKSIDWEEGLVSQLPTGLKELVSDEE